MSSGCGPPRSRAAGAQRARRVARYLDGMFVIPTGCSSFRAQGGIQLLAFLFSPKAGRLLSICVFASPFFARHSGVSRNPASFFSLSADISHRLSSWLVIPAQAGIHLLCSLWSLAFGAELPLALWASGLLSLVWPRESNQREGHPRCRALRASCPASPRAGYGVR